MTCCPVARERRELLKRCLRSRRLGRATLLPGEEANAESGGAAGREKERFPRWLYDVVH